MYYVILKKMNKTLRQREAGEILGLTARSVRRDPASPGRGRCGSRASGAGKPSNRRIPEKVKIQMLTLDTQRYGDFGHTLATEKLAERNGIITQR